MQQGYGLRLQLVLYARTLRNKQCLIEGQTELIPDQVTRSHVRIGRLAFWLVLSGTCSILSAFVFVLILLVTITPPRDDPATLFALFAVFAYSRIGTSFAQVCCCMHLFDLRRNNRASLADSLDHSNKTKPEN